MENVISGQHRRILFLFSLPSSKEFRQDIHEIEEFLQELNGLNVDIKNHLTKDDLMTINNYDIVIILAHHDHISDALVLEDGLLSMEDFIQYLPTDFKGVLDLASCNSVMYAQQIKQRCPDCQVHVALNDVPLLRRLIIYPTLIELLQEDTTTDYFSAFLSVSNRFNKILDDFSAEENPSDIYMNLLGQRMTSIYAPKQVIKDKSFWIYLFFFYDEESGTVNMMVSDWLSGKVKIQSFQVLLPLKTNGEVSATLKFLTKRPEYIAVMNGAMIRHITIRNTVVVEPFLIKVLPDYKEDVLKAEIRFSYNGLQFMSCSFNMGLGDKFIKKPADVVLDNVIRPDNEEQILKDYNRLFNAELIRKPYFALSEELNNDNKSKKRPDELTMKLDKIRKLFYSKKMYFHSIQELLNKINKELRTIQDNRKQDDNIPIRLISNLLSFHQFVNSDFQRIKIFFDKFSGHTFDEVEREFVMLERSYLDAVSDLIVLHDQTYTMKRLLLLKEMLQPIDEKDKNKTELKDLKENIKKTVTTIYKDLVKNGTDKDLLDIFQQGGTKSIIHSATQQMVTMPYLALVLAMAKGLYTSDDYGNIRWYINVLDYISLDNYEKKESLRMPKLRINNTVGLLDNKDIRECIRRYQMTKPGSISVFAFFLLNINVKTNRPIHPL